jgi:hypothetical protein
MMKELEHVRMLLNWSFWIQKGKYVLMRLGSSTISFLGMQLQYTRVKDQSGRKYFSVSITATRRCYSANFCTPLLPAQRKNSL